MPNSIPPPPATSPVDRQPEAQTDGKIPCFRQLAALIAVVALALLSACGPAAYVAPPISVTFTPGFTPPTAMTVSEQCGVAATVTNDPKNQGVTWKAACGSSSCGTFSNGGGGSSIPITYTSPATIPTGNTVTLTATSVTDPTKSVTSSPITIGLTSSGCTAP
jgi:uncharacterized membrane protein YgcG